MRITHDICDALESGRRDRSYGLEALKRHPIPIRAFFTDSLVLTYALPQNILRPLLPLGLMLDTFGGFGFVAIAMVQTKGLRPIFCPECVGRDFFLTGYRIFARYRTRTGRVLRGLRILRSDTDRRSMVLFGNLLTHYNYRLANVRCEHVDRKLEVTIHTPDHAADLHVVADLASEPAPLPEGSPFRDLREARLFAGPLPFTFDYEKQTDSIVMIEGVRKNWKPQSVHVDVLQNTFFDRPAFAGAKPILANAFHVANIPYEWKRGVREPLHLAA